MLGEPWRMRLVVMGVLTVLLWGVPAVLKEVLIGVINAIT